MSKHPGRTSTRLRWLWFLSILGGLLGLGLGGAFFLGLRALPIPGLHAWFLESFTLVGLSLLFFGWLGGLGFLFAQAATGLGLWSGRIKDEDDPIAMLAGTIAVSAGAALASSALLLGIWKTFPIAPYLALVWPVIASLAQILLLGVSTPLFYLLAKADGHLPSKESTLGRVAHSFLSHLHVALHFQRPRILIALHATALSFALWISPMAKTLEIRKIHHPLEFLLQGLVLGFLLLGHLWLAQVALLATLRNRVAHHLAKPIVHLTRDLPTPSPDFHRLFRPPLEVATWLRIPWSYLARGLLVILDRWEDWSQADDPTERLREVLAAKVPGLTGPIVLAILQILTALLPALLYP